MSKYDRVRRASQALLAEAFARLTAENVLPRSRYEPWIHVGHEFTGDLIMSLPSHGAFEAALETTFPDLFTGPPNQRRDFAGQYPYPLITAVVARLTRDGAEFRADDPEALASIEDLINLLRQKGQTVTCLRVVADLVLPGELRVGGLTILPRPGNLPHPSIQQTIEELIPEAGFLADEMRMATFGQDRALVIATSTSRPDVTDRLSDPFTTGADRNDLLIDRFLLALRLVTNATTPSLLAVRGSPGAVHRYPPQVVEHESRDWYWMRRPATINKEDARHLVRLGDLVASHVDPGPGRLAPLGLAVGRFSRSYQSSRWWERLVDLSIALEAVFGEADQKEEITLRLRSRAASLLACEQDPAMEIFEDIGRCYALRSIVVHGVSKTDNEVKKLVEKVPATAIGFMPKDKTDLLVDRFRDLVRRAILVRIALSTGPNPVWPFDRTNAMDRWLTDESDRRRLNSAWRRRIRSLGFPAAERPASTAQTL